MDENHEVRFFIIGPEVKRTLRKILLSVAACLPIAALQANGASGIFSDVRVIESTAGGITLEFVPRYTAGEKILSEGKTFQTIEFRQNSRQSYADAGKPDIRFRTIAIGLPGRRNNRVSVLSSEFQNVAGLSLAPVPALSPSQSNPAGKSYKQSASAFASYVPPALALLDKVGMVKGTYVGYLKIYPVQYSGETGAIKKYSRIVVRVEFGPRERTTAPAADDDWMRASLLNYPVVKRSLQASAAGKMNAASNSVLSSGTWYKLQISGDGMYKIDATYLAALGIDRTGIPSIRDIKIYGGNGVTLPADLTQPRAADLTQLPVLYVDANGNAKFDAEDYILFYGQGVTGWTYDPVAKQFSHYINHYTNNNVYFLQYAPGTGNGLQMANEAEPSSGTPVTTAVGKVFFQEEKTNVDDSGLEWYSAPMNPNDSRVIINKLDGYIPGSIINYKYELLSHADVTAVFSIQESGNQIASVVIPGQDDATLALDIYDYALKGDGTGSAVLPSPSAGTSNLKIGYSAAGAVATGYINWIELTYQQQLAAVGDALLFTSPDNSGSVEYDLSGYSSAPFSVFDITDSVKLMSSQAQQIAGTYLFRDNLTAGKVKRYWAGTTAAYKTPSSFVRIPNTNLRGNVAGADFVIVTHHDFVSEALRLKAHKEGLPGADALKTFVVEVDTLYNEFGNGLPDPVAIRDFLEYAVNNWQLPPRYVLFFGDACFDYKNILNLDRNWVPTYETPETDYQIYTYGYDDFYTYLEPGNTATASMPSGRLAVRSLDEARLTVDRIIQYESAPPPGTWKNLITIVSDDRNVDGALDDAPNPEQADIIAENDVPKSYDLKKIYEEAYPTVIASTGRTKPAVRQAIIDQINRGTLVMNYTGHGNPKVWSHETILTRDDVGTQFFNANMPTLFVAATCDWARYDDAASQSSAEVAIVNPNGGAIGVIAPDREVYSTENFELNDQLYQYYFPADQYARTPRLGDGLLMAKNNIFSDLDNSRKYHLLGDPTLRLAVPQLVMQIDSINGKPVSGAAFDTLQALSKVTVTASVRDVNGIIQNINSDSALVNIYDAEVLDSVFDSGVVGGAWTHSFEFLVPGPTIYKGENTIHNGRVSATFIIPKDISYENKQGKVAVYFSGNGTDGRGYTTQVIVGGTAASVANDTQGPTVTIYFDTRSFRSGDLVTESPTLIVDLSDSSGINDAGSGVGHGLEAWLDGDTKGLDLTDYYTGARDNYQAGTIVYQFNGLAPGKHTLAVRAWDVYNNPTTSQVDFSVAASTSLALENVYNIPDPVRSTTTFTFQHNQLTPINVEIKIYTVAGRLIQTLSSSNYPDRFVQIPWDCRDHDGSRIANGTYLYKVVAKTVDGKFASEALGKMAIVR